MIPRIECIPYFMQVADQLTTLSLSPPRDLANVEQDRAAARKPEGS